MSLPPRNSLPPRDDKSDITSASFFVTYTHDFATGDVKVIQPGSSDGKSVYFTPPSTPVPPSRSVRVPPLRSIEELKIDEPLPEGTTPGEVYPGKLRLTFIVLSIFLSVFTVALDRTIIAPAMYLPPSHVVNVRPQITVDFHSLSDAEWYGAVYFLTGTVIQPMWGKIFQLFHLKKMFVLVIFVFMVGSLICALSPNSEVFIFGRAMSGLGFGGMFAGGLTLLAHSVPLDKRPYFTGAMGAVYGVRPFSFRVLR
jgi:hypothetical protein